MALGRRGVEFLFKGDNRSVVKAMRGISEQSDKTSRAINRNSRESARSFDQVGKSAKGLHSSFGGLTGLLAGGGVVFGIKDVVQAGIRLQDQQEQLKGALHDSGVGLSQYARLNEVAAQSSVHGGFARDEEIQSLARFIRTTHDANAAIGANRAAILLARGAHLDYTQAQKYIQQALVGNVRRLQQYVGVIQPVKTGSDALLQSHKQEILALEAQAKAMGKAGPTWLKQQMAVRGLTTAQKQQATTADKLATGQRVLQRVQALYSTSLDRYNNSTAGRLANLKQSFEELKATIGLALLPTINSLAKKFASLAQFFSKHRTLTKDLIIATTILVATYGGLRIIEGLAGMTRALGVAFVGTAAAEDGAAVSSGVLAAAMDAIPILAIVGAIALLITHWKQVQQVAVRAWRAIQTAASDAWNWIKSNWSYLLPFLAGPFVGVAALVIRVFHKQIIGSIKSAWNWIKGAAKSVWDALTWPFRKAWDVISGIFNRIKGAFSSIVHGVGSALHTVSFGLLGGGGVVRPKYFAMGGPAGNDTIPGWLSPGEGVVNPTGMRILGSQGLNAVNHGHLPGGHGGGEYVTAPVQVKIDGRVVAEVVTRQVLRRAARGPSSLVGGSLATGVASPITVT